MSNRGRRTGGASSSQAPADETPSIGDVMKVLAEIGNLMGRQAQERAAEVAHAAEAAAAAAVNGMNGNNGQGAGGRHAPHMMEQFLKLQPPKFDGSGGPEAATMWMEQLEKAFAALGCTDEEKVTLAVYQLQGIANDWWNATRAMVFPEGIAPNWAGFREAFNGKYFSDAAQDRKMEEFQRLRQGQMSVDQYEAEFARLSKFAQRIMGNPWDRARRFRDGLRPELQSQLITTGIRDYNTMYERAQEIEKYMMERSAASGSRFQPMGDSRNFGKRPMVNARRFVPPAQRNLKKSSYANNGPCRICGRRHGNGPCPSRPGACFGCGQVGHIQRNCPRKAPGPQFQPRRPQIGPQMGGAPQNNLDRPPAQGRVYAVARKDAEKAPGVITGTVSLCNYPAYALFDPGASHSFVSAQFVYLAGMDVKPLDNELHVMTPLKDKVVVSLGCRDCKVVLGDKEESIDLVVLPMFDFDIIVGMDWLVRMGVVIDCSSRVIQLNPVGRPRYEFLGNPGGTLIPWVSSLEATKLMDEGCQGFLVHGEVVGWDCCMGERVGVGEGLLGERKKVGNKWDGD